MRRLVKQVERTITKVNALGFKGTGAPKNKGNGNTGVSCPGVPRSVRIDDNAVRSEEARERCRMG